MFVYSLSTTKPLSFSDQLHTLSLSLELTQTTEKRSKLQQLLKSIKDEKVKQINSNTNGKGKDDDTPPLLTQKDWLKVVQAAEDYMPMVYAIDRSLKTDDILINGELVFNWKETLTGSNKKTPLPGIQGELVHVLLINGKAICNLAATLVASVGNYEITEAAILSEEERKKKEERLKFAADLLCRAAGMFEFVGNDLMKEWENEIGLARLSQLGRSAESTREMCIALARLSQAEAELLAIRKLLSPTNCYQTATRTAAPPLPSSHPSPSLLSKLYLNAASHFESALSLAQTACNAIGVRSDDTTVPGESASEDIKQASSSGFKAKLVSKLGTSSGKLLEESTRTGKLNAGFVKYLTKSIFASQARAYVWLGIDKGERGQYGEAISFLRLAKEEIEGISSGNKISLHTKDDRKKDEKRKFIQERENVLKLITDWTRAYVQLNDTVGFQPIPPTSSLSSQIPAGRAATAIKPYKLPMPAFGPGSVGFISEGMQRWKGMGDDDAADSIGGTHPHGNVAEEEYAGQGAYY